MSIKMITDAIGKGVPLIVLSPHLDDAVLSCGALLRHAGGRTQVTVVTLFTEANPPPYTLSARSYLNQIGISDAEALYRDRRKEDQSALSLMNATCVHVGMKEALFRRVSRPGWRSVCCRLLPELAHVYPVYRLQITSGRVSPADAGTLEQAQDIIARMTRQEPALVLAPMGVGGHVDHVLTRKAAEHSDAPVVYYSDFPYNQRYEPDADFIRRNGLIETQWSEQIREKFTLINEYRTQVGTLFSDGSIPEVPEIFFSKTLYEKW